MLIEEDIPIMDIRSKNILVQELNGKQEPVFIDYKRFGSITYPTQFWLRNPEKMNSKIHRRFQRLKEIYQ